MTDNSRQPNLKANNESQRHIKGKLRLCKIFRDRGFSAEVERPMPCYVQLGDFTAKYKVDVFATRGQRKIIAEVDGPVGHSSTQTTVARKGLRTYRIRETYGQEIQVFRFTFERLSKWSNEEIAQEMNLQSK